MTTARDDFEHALTFLAQALDLSGDMAEERGLAAARSAFKLAGGTLGALTSTIATYAEAREESDDLRAAAQAIVTGLSVGGIAVGAAALGAPLSAAIAVSFVSGFVVPRAVQSVIDRVFDAFEDELDGALQFASASLSPGSGLFGIVTVALTGADLVLDRVTDDWLFGLGRRDRLDGGEGDDVLMGGNRNDRLDGGNGSDILIGQGGADVVRGGFGNDTIIATDALDNIRGGEGFLMRVAA
jgi:Ca2+-binding RTX toxin-like protein